jgi:hypothetical protein
LLAVGEASISPRSRHTPQVVTVTFTKIDFP